MSSVLTNDEREQLVKIAGEAQAFAYTPYSHYPVGAALLASDGSIYRGANIENAAYPVTICAERVAVFKAVSEGNREFKAIAIVTRNSGFPCGSCRQVLAEFGLDTQVLIADEAGNISAEYRVGDLLPGAFGPQDLLTSG